MSAADADHRFELSRGQKAFKLGVYSLLLINFCFYLVIDINNAAHTLNADSTLLNITSAFATSTGVLAWLTLIGLLELETYTLDDDAWTGRLTLIVHSLRLLCFVVIAHFVFAVVDYVIDLYPETRAEGVLSLCQVADQERSWTYNLDYQDITPENCADLSAETVFYEIPESPVIVDGTGLALERQLAWSGVVEIVSWIVIILATEVMVRLQERKVVSGRVMSTLRSTKNILYGVLIATALWWLWLGHVLFTWDTMLWVLGFAVIEMNMRTWRDEIAHQQQQTAAPRANAAQETGLNET
ncbi:MAG: hypothetical protein AAGH19_01630 [Pseudomonadota bacterium]